MAEVSREVFLNVPFDRQYEPIFLGLIAALVHLGRRPTTVLDIEEVSAPRIDRLVAKLRRTPYSVHDLSRVELSGGRAGVPRFNMPFELGLAVAVSRTPTDGTRHGFVLLERRPARLQRTLSDMNGYDPLIHGGTSSGAVRCMFEAFAEEREVDLVRVRRLARQLSEVARTLKRQHGTSTVFHRVLCRELIGAAAALSDGAGGGRRPSPHAASR
jgi:hypothetical protein